MSRVRFRRLILEPLEGRLLLAPFVQEATLTTPSGNAQDFMIYYGRRHAMSGDTVVVGMPNNSGSNDIGKVYVFQRSASGWGDMTQTATLTASDGAAGNAFGYSVAVSGRTIVVGAPGAPGTNQVGAAYVFVEPAGGWHDMTETAKLTPNDGGGGNRFGQAVAISGDTAVVTAESYDYGAASPDPDGAAYVFKEPDAGWANMTQTAELTEANDTSNGGNLFGATVATNGSTVVVGAPGATCQTSTGGWTIYGPGLAFVFTMTANGWVNGTQTAVLSALDGNNGDRFGDSLAINGHTIVVGAINATTDWTPAMDWQKPDSGSGAAYVFVEPNTGWETMTETAKLTASDAQPPSWDPTYPIVGKSDGFGCSVQRSAGTPWS